jgi:hypothetical protein
MPYTPPPPAHPVVECRIGHDAIIALADLFNCVDQTRWNSVARPNPRGIAALLWIVAGEIEPPPPPS